MIPRRRSLSTQKAGKPRASGDDPIAALVSRQSAYVNPARAGMIRPFARITVPMGSKPRASGDDPVSSAVLVRCAV